MELFCNRYLPKLLFLGLYIPYVSHIFSAVLPSIYYFEIVIITSILLSFGAAYTLFSGQIFLKGFLYFTPMLLISSYLVTSGINISHVKYIGYIGVHFLLFRALFFDVKFFKLYINFFAVIVAFLMVLFFASIAFEIYEPFILRHQAHIEVMIASEVDVALYRSDFGAFLANSPMSFFPNRAIVFGVLIFDPSDSSGVFPFQRFYGFSREPGFFTAFTVPAMLMALYLRMRFQAVLFLCATVLASSFAGFLAVIIGSLIVLCSKRLISVFVVLCIGTFMVEVIFELSTFSNLLGAERILNYQHQFNVKLERLLFSFTFWEPGNEKDVQLLVMNNQVVGPVQMICERLAICFIVVWAFLNGSKANTAFTIGFLFSVLLLIYKANEILPPLFLFYVSFLEVINRDSTIKSLNKLRIENGSYC